jgi:hypothetical protein
MVRSRIMYFFDKKTTILTGVIVLLLLARITILPLSPPGFYSDEAATGAHVVAMVKHHTNAQGQSWPLFSKSLGGGFTTPVYLYPLSIWASLFGVSELALRAFSQFVTIFTIITVGASIYLWLGKKAGLIAMIVALALPWGWLQGSIAWDPVMVPLFIAITFFGFSLLVQRTSLRLRLTGMILLPLSLILLAYVYPPYWVVAPLLFISMYSFLIVKKYLSYPAALSSTVATLTLVIPLLLFIVSPDTLTRSSTVSIFYHANLLEAMGLFIRNIILLSQPFFLFIFGDFNVRQSIGYQGMLGLGAVAPIIILIVIAVKKIGNKALNFLTKQELLLIGIAAMGYLLSLFGSALTNEGQPQSLRSCGAWPFAVVIITIGWLVILRQHRQWLKQVTITIFIMATIAYMIDLAYVFPTSSGKFFDTVERSKILSHQTIRYPELALQYYNTR